MLLCVTQLSLTILFAASFRDRLLPLPQMCIFCVAAVELPRGAVIHTNNRSILSLSILQPSSHLPCISCPTVELPRGAVIHTNKGDIWLKLFPDEVG